MTFIDTVFKKALFILLTLAGSSHGLAAAPVLDQLTPENSLLMLIDYQPQYAFATQSISIDTLLNNATGLTKAARVFKVPTLITTITAQAYGGPSFPQVQAAAPDAAVFDRTPINAWQDKRIADFVRTSGRKKVVMAGLWTDNCVMLPALAALAEGYEVYVVTDVSGDLDAASHERAIQRLVQAGAVPITWVPVMLEWQADWTRKETATQVSGIIADHVGAMAVGSFYLRSMKK